MLTTDEVIDLLTLAAAYDRRKVGAADVAAWSDAAHRGRWTAEAAMEAVKEHYARSTAWLMPGHITELIRADRRQPAPVHEVLALPRAEQATADQRAAAIAAFAQRTAAAKDLNAGASS